MDLGLKVLGLTGGVGMGKSTAATLLGARGVTIVDTDLLARELVEPGQPALAEIRDAFGADVIAPDGRLRREQLARRVFGDRETRERLEAILHPRIRQLWQSQLNAWRLASAAEHRAGDRRFFCVVIPLLFETHAESEMDATKMDATICVACSSATQRQRLAARNWTTEEISQRIESQLPTEEKMQRADIVIWNEGPIEILALQLDRLLRCCPGKRY